MINGLAGQFFTFLKQINVNDFANLNPQYGKIRSSPPLARLSTIHMSAPAPKGRISTAPLFSKTNQETQI